MTAHPKLDPITGEMVFIGNAAKGRFTADVALHLVDADGRLASSQMLQAPYPSMLHDFVITRDWIIVPVFPLTGSMDRAMKGAPPYAWEPDKGTHIALVPRRGSVTDVRWFKGDPCYVFHANAAEGDGFVLVVIWRAQTNSSDLAIFDAARLPAGPVALAHLSHRVPSGFHGNWRGAGR